MRLFKATYKPDGQKRFSRKWYLDFVDHNEIRHRIPGFADRHGPNLGRQIESLIALRAGRERPDKETQRWIDTLPRKLLREFVSWVWSVPSGWPSGRISTST